MVLKTPKGRKRRRFRLPRPKKRGLTLAVNQRQPRHRRRLESGCSTAWANQAETLDEQ
jgi:hypothetical protein